MLNKAVLIGRLVKDIELRQTTSGKMVGTFAVAVDNGYGDNKTTDFINCVAWGKQAEFIKNYFGKGRMIVLVGRIATRSFESGEGQKRYVTEVVVNEVEFAGEKKEEADNSEVDSVYEGYALKDDDSDLPF